MAFLLAPAQLAVRALPWVGSVTYAVGSRVLDPVPQQLPNWRGTGALSSTVPGYVVSYAGAPATCILDLFDRATNIYIKSTVANPVDGSFTFSGLNTARRFDVRARGDGFTPAENDLILSDLTPG